MKEELMEEVMQSMLSYLDNAQMKQLRQVLEHVLCNYEVNDWEMKPEEDDSNNLITRFIAEADRGMFGKNAEVLPGHDRCYGSISW